MVFLIYYDTEDINNGVIVVAVIIILMMNILSLSCVQIELGSQIFFFIFNSKYKLFFLFSYVILITLIIVISIYKPFVIKFAIP